MDEKQIKCKCQENPWLKRGGVMFIEDLFADIDYEYSFTRFSNLFDLCQFFKQGNWAIRQGAIFGNLCFINQVNGGDEWWTLKQFGDELVAFESISFLPVIREGEFYNFIERLSVASKEECIKLEY